VKNIESSFPGLEQGQVINNDKLIEIFDFNKQGGMRKSNKHNSLVLVNNTLKTLYSNRWDNDILYYTGAGEEYDQKLNRQNKTLFESSENGVMVYLFEKFTEREYTYRGRVKLASEPFQETQKDKNNLDREVLIFPLKIVGQTWNPNVKVLNEIEKKKAKSLKRLSLEEITERAKRASKKVSKRKISENSFYERDIAVKLYSLAVADGICQLCEQPAPFKNKNGDPFLESHHIEWLSQGGTDTIDNVVALCPNCHRKMHIIDKDEDIQILKKKCLIKLTCTKK